MLFFLVSLTFAGKYHQAIAECKINFLTMLINIFHRSCIIRQTGPILRGSTQKSLINNRLM
ncbi:hypothetical protein DBR09_08915 [Aeromonas sp. HMWF016]|nr:hypothetical protein DBR09_08915 [Aeromonas sp. HMWF016]